MPSSNDQPWAILTENVDGNLVKEIEALFDADLIAQANACEDARGLVGQQNRQGARPINGDLGMAPTLRVHGFDYHAQRYLGHNWDDPEFARWFAKRHEYARVQVEPGRRVVVHPGGISSGVTRKFHKVYP